MEQSLEERVQEDVVDGRLPCAAAFKIAADLQIPPRTVGETCDRLHIRIAACQLGCFP